MSFSSLSSINNWVTKRTGPAKLADVVSTTNLLYYFTCDTADVSSTTLKNNQTNTYDLTLGNTPISTTVSKNGTASLKGYGNYGFIKTPVQYSNSAFTISFWYYTDCLTNNSVQSAFVCRRSDTNTITSGSQLYDQELEIRINTNGDGTYMQWVGYSRNSLLFDLNGGQYNRPNVWNHVALIKDGTSTFFYLNGSLKATDTSYSSAFWGTGQVSCISFMLDYQSNTRQASGYMDDIRIYNRALSGTEISTIANIVVPTSGLVFYQSFNSDFSDSIGGLTMTNTGCTINTTSQKLGAGCLSFDKNKNIKIGSFINWGTSNSNFSLSFWLNLTSSVVGTNNSSSTQFLTLMGRTEFLVNINFTGSTYKLSYDWIGPGNGDGLKFPSTGIALNTWSHFVFTQNAGTLKAYYNGTQVYSYYGGVNWTNSCYAAPYNGSAWGSSISAYSWINNGDPNILGASSNFTGLFDGYRVYSRPITQAEITQLYNEA